MSSHTNSPPVIVVMKANNCGHCRKLHHIWPEIKMQIESDRLNVRIVQVDFPNMSSPIPPGYPSDLKRFTAWFPMVLMIPGADWDQAMTKLHSHSKYVFPRVTVFNGEIINNKLKHAPKYNVMNPKSFSQWVQSVLALPGYNEHTMNIDVDIPSVDKPATGKAVRYHPTFGMSSENNDVCSMRLVPKNG